jgi:3-oxoacyl-[acyl-carrier protein] reductase
MELELAGRLALVTASTGGIGRAIATSLARERATVIVNGRTADTVDAAIAAIAEQVPGASLEPLVADNGTAAGAEETIARFPEVDILVNNLGVYETVSFFDETDEAWQHVFDVNVMSGVRLARRYLRRMLAARGGRVVFIASEAAITPPPDMVSYSATKAMQLSISRSLAELTKGTGVTVNTVMPGTTKTEGLAAIVRDAYADLPLDEGERRFVAEERPTSLIGRLIRPEEIGDLVAYVCSARGGAINGAALRIDGGLVRSIL